jgi:hypothetical protein
MKRDVEFQMREMDALIERLFPVTTSEILGDNAALDFSFVVPSKVSQTVDILPKMHADISVAKRFNVTLRTIRERARARNLGRKLGGTRWFTEAEIIGLMTCSSSASAKIQPVGTRAGHTLKSPLTKALELATERKLKFFSPRSKKTSSSGKRVVPFSPRKHSPTPH